MPELPIRPGPWLFGALAALLCGVVALLMTGLEGAAGLGLPVLLAVLALFVWLRQPRRALIAALFFLAPIDVSKAVVPPLDQFYSPGLYMTPAHLVTLLLLALVLGRRLLWERRLGAVDGLDLLVALFLGAIWWRAATSPQGTLALATAAAYSLAVLACYAASGAIRDMADLRLALAAAAVSLLLEGGHVAAQMLTGSLLPLPGSKNQFPAALLSFGSAGSAMRPIGFQSHPNSLAHHMVVMFPPALALVMAGRRWLSGRVWGLSLAVVVVALLALLLTLSRGGWAAGMVAVAVLVMVLRGQGMIPGRRLAGWALAAGVAGALVVAAYPQLVLRLTEPDSRSTESRLLLTDQALAIIRANPWTGVGYGAYNRAAFEYVGPAFATVSEDYQQQLRKLVVHNHYLLLAAELGLPAMGLFMLLLWRFIRLPWPLRRFDDPATLALAVGLSASLAGQALFLSSDNYYVDLRLFLLWLTVGVLHATVRLGTSKAAA
jgi:putative inorganic carbon (HCO3(-)) transporter